MLLHDLRRTTKNENERMRKQTDDCLHLPLQVSADTEEVAFAETDRQTDRSRRRRRRAAGHSLL